MDDPAPDELFYELFTGLPRQGPGSCECTRQALSLIPPLDAGERILDIGAGTGAQTFDLARSTPATILAIDARQSFIEELNATAARLDVAGRVRGIVGDMTRLDFPAGHFDVLWSEGAIYNIGFDAGLESWRPLLRQRGHAALSEMCLFVAEPPAECREFLLGEYPAVRDEDSNRKAITRAGYTLIGEFRLPVSAWWRNYYGPLEGKLAAYRSRHEGSTVASAIAAAVEREIEMFRRYSDCYGYVFFVMRKGE